MHSNLRPARVVPVLATITVTIAALASAWSARDAEAPRRAWPGADQPPPAAVLRTVVVAPPERQPAGAQPAACDHDCAIAVPAPSGRY